MTVDFEECLKDSPRFRCRRERASPGRCGGTGRGGAAACWGPRRGREAGLSVCRVTGRAVGPGLWGQRLWGPRRVTGCGQAALRRVAGWGCCGGGYVGRVGKQGLGSAGGGCGGRV